MLIICLKKKKKIDNIEEDKKDEIPLEEKGISAPIKTEEKINNVVGTLNQLHVNDKEKVLKALEQNAKDDKKQKTLSQLRDKIRKVHQLNILVGSMKKNEKLTEEEIDEIAYNFSHDLYYKDKEPNSSLENLIKNENEENKIDNLAESIKKMDKNDQDKALLIISNYAENDEQKEKAKKLPNLVKNIKNMKSYFCRMIKNQINKDKDKEKDVLSIQPLEGDIPDDEIAQIADSFWVDLKNSGNDKERSTNDTIHNFANIVKEFKPVDQEKTVKLLKARTKEENKNIDEIKNLENKINDLNKMKNEIESYKKTLTINKKKISIIT